MKEDQKVVLITGAASGIGKATALQFAEQDYRLVLVDRNAEGLQQLTIQLESSGREALMHAGDLQDINFVQSVINRTADAWGQIDVLVNNAAWENARNHADYFSGNLGKNNTGMSDRASFFK